MSVQTEQETFAGIVEEMDFTVPCDWNDGDHGAAWVVEMQCPHCEETAVMMTCEATYNKIARFKDVPDGLICNDCGGTAKPLDLIQSMRRIG